MKSIVLALIIIAGSACSYAQTTEEVKKKFPGEEAVLLNSVLIYKITIKDGAPAVESKDVQQFMYLSANAGAYMSKYGFTHSSFHELEEYAAYTKTPDNKKIKVTDFKTTDSKSSGIFYDDVKETSFDFPAISPGAIGTLELSMLHKDAHLLSPYYFARSIPVMNSELRISFPKSMSVKYLLKGNDTARISVSQETRRGETTFIFKATDIPSERGYADAPDNAYYTPHVVFYIERYKDEKGNDVTFLNNLDDLLKMNYNFVKEINKTASPDLKRIVDSITSKANSNEEKARLIYKWVQEHIKYVAFEEGMEGFIPRDANLVCSRRFGDCKDMSSILTLMLNTAGVTAYYTWIGTREIPYKYSEIPTPIVDNHMICTIKLNNQYIFLDGTDPSCVFGVPSEGIQGKEAFLLITEKEYKVLQVPVPEKEKNSLVDSTFITLTENGIKGNVSRNLTGYYAMGLNNELSFMNQKDKEDYFKDYFVRGSNKFELQKFDVGDRSDKNHIRLTADFQLKDYARIVAGEWYLNLNLFKLYEHQEIDYPKRKMPIEFSYRSVKKYVTVLQIPAGYVVSYLPKSKTFSNDTWGFEINYEQKNNQVILTQSFYNDYLMLYPDKFQAWNKVLEELFPLYKETIILSKK
jgi:hypothetical protein